jgi:hypothetical protein
MCLVFFEIMVVIHTTDQHAFSLILDTDLEYLFWYHHYFHTCIKLINIKFYTTYELKAGGWEFKFFLIYLTIEMYLWGQKSSQSSFVACRHTCFSFISPLNYIETFSIYVKTKHHGRYPYMLILITKRSILVC